MSRTMTLAEIEAKLRAIKVRPGFPTPRVKPVRNGRPPRQRDRAITGIHRLAAEACGGAWDEPVAWKPIHAALWREGLSDDTIRRALRHAGIIVHPHKGHRLAYPPGVSPSPRRASA